MNHHTFSRGTRRATASRQQQQQRPIALLALAAAAAAASLYAPPSARAASATWVANPTDANWTTATNWSTGAAPGATAPSGNNTRNNDVATFNTPIFNSIGDSTNPILFDNTRFIKGITFDANAGPYVIGSAADSSTILYLDNAGSIQMNAGVTSPETIAGFLRIRQQSSTNGTYNFVNNATSSDATLSFTNPVFTLTNANGRPTTLTLSGSNTGLNTISSDITDSWSSAQGVAAIIKSGTGTWRLTGNNAGIIGSNTTNTNAMLGIVINAGTLIAANNNALGSSGTANQLKVAINSGATLQLANNPNTSSPIAIDNGVSLNLNDGGTIQSNGSQSTNGRINVSTTATSVTISTVNATDVFTIGNEANDVTGGSADTVINVEGPGQILLNQSSNYVGSWSFNGGTATLGNGNALGTSAAGVTVSVGSTGRLQLNSQSVTVGKLTSAGAAGVIENGGSGNSTLTLDTAADNAFGATLRDGAGGGNLALVKAGFGSLTLSGPSTYTGGTTVNTGSLVATNTTGSATGTGPVTLNNLTSLAGTGAVAGQVTLNSGATLSPGVSGVGTLSVGSLNLQPGSSLAWDVTNSSTLDKVVVTNAGGLNIDGGTLTLNGGAAPFITNGVYNLISYAGSITGSGVSALAVDAASKNTGTNSYTFGTANGFVTLTIASSGGAISYWNADASSTWSAGPWTTPSPNAPGAFASFGGGGTPITADRTVTVDNAFTVGTLAFNDPAHSYTLAAGAGGSITLDNSGSGAFVTDSAGSHAIQAPLAMTASGATFTVTGAADTLTVSNTVSGNGATLTKSGAGTLVLSGANTYTGGTNLRAGTLQINSAASLGDPAGTLTFNGGVLQLAADVTTARNYQVNALADAEIDTNGHTLSLTGSISPTPGSVGGVVKNGSGTLALNGTNSYTGPTTVNAGTLSINSNASLGDQATGAALNLGSGTTLDVTASTSLNNGAAGSADRSVTIGAAGATVNVADSATLSLTGNLAGGTLAKTGPGTLSVNSPSSTIAGYDVSAGTLNAGLASAANGGGLGSAVPVTLRGGATLTSSASGSSTFSFNNPLTVPAGETANINTPQRFNWSGAVSGGGTLNVTVNSTSNRFDLNNNFANFTGTLNLGGNGNGRILINGGSFNGAGLAGATLVLSDSVVLNPSSNTNANTVTIGALSSSSSTAGFGPETQGGGFNFNVGALNTNTSYAGFIQGSAALTKVGSGTLTVSGNNSYTGATTVNAGTLRLDSDTAFPSSSNLVVNTGGTLDLNGHNVSTPTLNGTGGTVLLSGNLNVNSGTNTSFGGSVTGTGSVTTTGNNVVTLGSVVASTVNVTFGRIALNSPTAASRIETLNTNGTLELDSRLILPNTSVPDATTFVLSGRGSGAWDGFSGITTVADGHHGIAIFTPADAGGITTFGDLPLTGTETLLYSTWYGDLNLDGRINGDDYTRIDRGAAKHLTGWLNGDLNYDGAIDAGDYFLMDSTYGAAGVPHDAWTALLAQRESQFGDAYVSSLIASVPEPTTLSLLGFAALPLLSRRRRTAR